MKTMTIVHGGQWWVVLLMLLAASTASAQSSANFTLAPGAIGAGGSSSSTNFMLTDFIGRGRARASSANYDVTGGFVGGAFSAVATVSFNTAANPGFTALAFPVNATSNTVGSVLSELGAYDNTTWRLGHWSAADSAYMEPGAAGALNLTTLEIGQGYWITTKTSGTANDVGLPAPVGPFRIPILGTTTAPPQPRAAAFGAWNQIGNPFLFPVDVSGLQVTDGVTPVSLTSVSNTFTDQVVKGWDATASAYVNVTVMNGRTAYWVHKKNGIPAAITLLIPYQASAAGSAVPLLAKPAGADWAVAITAHQGTRSCEPMLVGASAFAPGPQNPLNLSRAPAPPVGSFLSLHLPKGEWGGDMVRDFQPQADHMSWDFVASGGEAPGEMSLQIEGFDLPAGTTLSLTDITAGTTRAVTPGQTVTMAATATPRPLRLEAVSAGAVGPSPTILQDALRYAYPNPFAASTGFAFALSRGGDIRIDIYDVAGRNVRQLARAAKGPGEYVLIWDGRDANGKSLPSGVYLARYRAGTASGVRRLIRVE